MTQYICANCMLLVDVDAHTAHELDGYCSEDCKAARYVLDAVVKDTPNKTPRRAMGRGLSELQRATLRAKWLSVPESREQILAGVEKARLIESRKKTS